MDSLPAAVVVRALRHTCGDEVYETALAAAASSEDTEALVSACARALDIARDEVLHAVGRSVVELVEQDVLPPIGCNVLVGILALDDLLKSVRMLPEDVTGTAAGAATRWTVPTGWKFACKSVTDSGLDLHVPVSLRGLVSFVMGAVLALCSARCRLEGVTAELLPPPPVAAGREASPVIRITFPTVSRAPSVPALATPGFLASSAMLAACPWLLVLDSEMRVLAAGRALLEATPGLQPGADAAALLRVVHPAGAPLERDALLMYFADAVFDIALPTGRGSGMPDARMLRGSFHDVPATAGLVFIGSEPAAHISVTTSTIWVDRALPRSSHRPSATGSDSGVRLPATSTDGEAALMTARRNKAASVARTSSGGRAGGLATNVRLPVRAIRPEEQCDGDWELWWSIIQLLPETSRCRMIDLQAALDAKDMVALRTAAHALKGAAESCCATTLADVCFDLEAYAEGFARLLAGNVEAGAVADEDFQPACDYYLPRVLREAEVVATNIARLEVMSGAQRVSELLTAEGFPELCVRQVPESVPEIGEEEGAEEEGQESWFSMHPGDVAGLQTQGAVKAEAKPEPEELPEERAGLHPSGRESSDTLRSLGGGPPPFRAHSKAVAAGVSRRSLDATDLRKASEALFGAPPGPQQPPQAPSDAFLPRSQRLRSSGSNSSDGGAGQAAARWLAPLRSGSDPVEDMWIPGAEAGCRESARFSRLSSSDCGLIDCLSSRLTSSLAPHVLGKNAASDVDLQGIVGRLAAQRSVEGAHETVMVIDDNPMVTLIMERGLAGLGYRVIVAASAEQALSYLGDSANALPHILIVDVFFGPMQITGLEMTERLRTAGVSNIVLPIVLMSSHNSKALAEGAYEAGANDWMSKPVSTREVAARVREQMRMLRSVNAEAEARLLQHFLPKAVIKKLKDGKPPFTEPVPQMCILFADIVSFTKLCSAVPAERVVGTLHSLFSAFDQGLNAMDVFKVDTVGDAYICSTGCALTEEKGLEKPASRLLRFAKEMLRITSRMQKVDGWDQRLQIRVGIHTGPVIAAAVGQKSFKFTFIGDAVNTASRMESHGRPGCVHCSEPFMEELVKEGLAEEDFVPRGEMDIKGKGRMRTYLAKVGEWTTALP